MIPINEIVKNFLRQPHDNSEKESSQLKKDNILIDLTQDDLYPNTGAFFDDDYTSVYGHAEMIDIIHSQKNKIMKYRNLATTADVTDALDEIVNEIIFSFDDKMPLKINIDLENQKLKDAITDKFKKITKLLNIKRNLFQIVKTGYIDGMIIMHCAYDKKSTKNGLKSIKMIEPALLYFDVETKTYKYMKEEHPRSPYGKLQSEEYSTEEIVREDFGLYDGAINLSYLEYAVKPANMLKTLEDLLVPLRFSRSISRRVFNVDIGDLPSKRGAEVMREYQKKFKYKKFYNNETGEVSNQQHITSMVEDYWFSNRSGGKGTQVDMLDETGNLGELNDILYFSKKLYRALKIPNSRISIDPEADHEFDYESTRVTKEDMKFFMFISRLRQVYSNLFKEILKREVVSTGILKESEWETYEEEIEISFVRENSFIQKLKLDNFQGALDIYASVIDYQGKLFPVEYVLKEIFHFSDEQIEENFQSIQKEKTDPLYAGFYKADDEDDSW